jgi:hypothetical protein
MVPRRELGGGAEAARARPSRSRQGRAVPGDDTPLDQIGQRWTVLARFWVPEDDILRRSRRDRVPYDVWRDQGLLTATPGNATDFAFDGISALVNALGRALLHDNNRYVYQGRTMVVLSRREVLG